MALMLNNYLEYKGISLKKEGVSTPFIDQDEVSLWAKDAVTNMKLYGLITGIGNNTYSPKATANRAGTAQIFKNFVEAYISR